VLKYVKIVNNFTGVEITADGIEFFPGRIG
jgi:hypothetical protein